MHKSNYLHGKFKLLLLQVFLNVLLLRCSETISVYHTVDARQWRSYLVYLAVALVFNDEMFGLETREIRACSDIFLTRETCKKVRKKERKTGNRILSNSRH